MNKQFAVLGLGSFGRSVALSLGKMGCDVMVVDDSYEKIQEISDKVAQIVTTPDINAKVEVIYQSVENLHRAIPVHNGDWYFTGNYPTPGGNVVANKAFINYYENRNERAY